jgi:hypothetical protein
MKDSNAMISEKQFLEFKKRYDEFEKKQQAEILEKFKQDFHRFNSSYQAVTGLADELDRNEAPQFNVFSILDRGHLEVLTHTPFLAELLNPRGTHGQKDLFLRCFLRKILKYSPAEASDPNWHVIKEYEYVDLRIFNYSLRKAIFIENKIYTDAHSGQLSRYFSLWENHYSKNGAFIYLTPDGKAPNETGFDDLVYKKDEIMKVLLCLSYKEDICNWLEETLFQIASPKVRETIIQYIDLIKKI